MGMVRDILKATARRILADEQRYYDATVTSGDVAGEGRGHRMQLQQVIQRYHKWVYICTNINSVAVASVPLRVYRRKRAGVKGRLAWDHTRPGLVRVKHLRETAGTYVRKAMSGVEDADEITDFAHPLRRLLDAANPHMDGFEMLYALNLSFELVGNAYLYTVSQGRVPAQLWPLQPQYVRPVPVKRGLIGRYEYGRDMEVEETFTPAEIIQFKNWNPLDPYNGYGPLMAMVPDVDMGASITQFRQSMLDKACQPGLIVRVPNADEKTRAAIEAKLNAKHAGAKKAGRSMVISGRDIEIDPWEAAKESVGLIADEESVRDTVAAIFQTPRNYLTTDGDALAIGKTASPFHQLMCVRPRCRRIEDKLNEVLVPQFNDPDLFVAFDNAVDDDEEMQSKIAVAEYAGGIRKRNEARAMRSLEPDPDGDVYVDQVQTANAGSLLEQQAALEPKDEDEGEDKPRDKDKRAKGGQEDEDEDRTGIDVRAGHNGDVHGDGLHVRVRDDVEGAQDRGAPAVKLSDAIHHGPACACCTHTPRTLRTKDDRADHATDTAERKLEARLRAWYLALLPHILADLGDDPAGARDRVTLHLSLPSVHDSLAEAIQPDIVEVFGAGYDGGLRLLGDRVPPTVGAFAVTAEDAVRHLDTYRIRLAQSVTQTTADQLTAAIQAGVENADSIRQLTERVKAVMQNLSDVSAERIARTESARAYLRGRELAWERTGVVKGKQWLLSADPCPVCTAIAEKVNIRPLGVPFLAQGERLELEDGTTFHNDYAAMDTPPAHPQCRCSTGAVFDEEVIG